MAGTGRTEQVGFKSLRSLRGLRGEGFVGRTLCVQGLGDGIDCISLMSS